MIYSKSDIIESLTKEEKLLQLNNTYGLRSINPCNEIPLIEIKESSKKIVNHFGESIKYCDNVTTVQIKDKKKVEVGNLYQYKTIEDVFNHFSDNSKIYYFIRLEKMNWYNLIVIEQENISFVRNESIKNILSV